MEERVPGKGCEWERGGQRERERERKARGSRLQWHCREVLLEVYPFSSLSLCRVCVLFSKSGDELLSIILREHRGRTWEVLNGSGENGRCGNKQC